MEFTDNKIKNGLENRTNKLTKQLEGNRIEFVMDNKQTNKKLEIIQQRLGRIIKCKNTRWETTGKVASVKGKI